jgi:hypothetical protein
MRFQSIDEPKRHSKEPPESNQQHLHPKWQRDLLVSEDNGAGHAYFHFPFGIGDYSNVSNSVVGIKH